MANPSARKGLVQRSTNDIRLAPPACSMAPERPRTDISLAQRGPWSPGRHVPRKVAILPREVSFAARNYQNGLPAPLARDRGAPHTQLGDPVTRAALGARLDQVSPEVLAGYLPATTARGPACPPRARRACWACVGGPWHLVQRIPASVAPLVRSPGVSAPPCPVVRRTTIPWSSHRASAHAVRACREGAGRPHGL